MIDTWKSYTKKVTFYGENWENKDLDIYITVAVNQFCYPKKIGITIGKEGGIFSVYHILCQFINLALDRGTPVNEIIKLMIHTAYRPQNLPVHKSITDAMAKFLMEFPKFACKITKTERGII